MGVFILFILQLASETRIIAYISKLIFAKYDNIIKYSLTNRLERSPVKKKGIENDKNVFPVCTYYIV